MASPSVSILLYYVCTLFPGYPVIPPTHPYIPKIPEQIQTGTFTWIITSALSLLFVLFLFWDGGEQEQSNCLTMRMKNSPVMGMHDEISHSTWNLGVFFIQSQELTHEKSLPLVSQKARMTGLAKFYFWIGSILLHSIFTHAVKFLISMSGTL